MEDCIHIQVAMNKPAAVRCLVNRNKVANCERVMIVYSEHIMTDKTYSHSLTVSVSYLSSLKVLTEVVNSAHLMKAGIIYDV